MLISLGACAPSPARACGCPPLNPLARGQGPAPQGAVGAAFAYQGQLKQNGFASALSGGGEYILLGSFWPASGRILTPTCP